MAKECKKCGNPQKMYWCKKCESNGESTKCDDCGGKMVLDKEYHDNCETEYTKISNRITEIWDELSPQIAGTGIADLIEELVELEIEAETYCNQ